MRNSRQAKKGKHKKYKNRTAVFFVVLAMIMFLAAGFVSVINRKEQRAAEVLQERIRDLKQLVTVEQTYRSVIYTENKTFWVMSRQVLFSVKYHVRAGVDFSGGLELNRLPGGVIQVTMPSAKIFSSDADESTIHQMMIKESAVFNPVRISDYMPLIIRQGEVNRKAALDSGILKLAENNAKLAVKRILAIGGFSQVVFTDSYASLDSLSGSNAEIESGVENNSLSKEKN